METRYAVLSPTARPGLGSLATPRPASAGALRLAFIWDYLFRGDEINAAVREAVQARAAGSEFVQHEVFGDIHGADERAVVADIPDKLLEYRVSAAIVGVGA